MHNLLSHANGGVASARPLTTLVVCVGQPARILMRWRLFSMHETTTLTTIAVLGFSVAFLHAAIPTHWLPFVLVGRARGWSWTRTIAVTLGAGLGHVALTSLLGLAIAWFGFKLNETVSGLFPWIAGGVLTAILHSLEFATFKSLKLTICVFLKSEYNGLINSSVILEHISSTKAINSLKPIVYGFLLLTASIITTVIC
jgi:hypothetical protein